MAWNHSRLGPSSCGGGHIKAPALSPGPDLSCRGSIESNVGILVTMITTRTRCCIIPSTHSPKESSERLTVALRDA